MRVQPLFKMLLGCAFLLCVAGVKAETLFACMYHPSVTGGVRTYNSGSGAFLGSFKGLPNFWCGETAKLRFSV